MKDNLEIVYNKLRDLDSHLECLSMNTIHDVLYQIYENEIFNKIRTKHDKEFIKHTIKIKKKKLAAWKAKKRELAAWKVKQRELHKIRKWVRK
jgi:hypothetical protein